MKRKNLIAILSAWIGLSVAPLAPAQISTPGSIRGVVNNDATGAYVEGAEVTLGTTPARTDVTDSQGQFFIGGIAPGTYRLQVASAGSTTTDIPVEVQPGVVQTLAVSLKSDIVMLAPLMVTAQAEGQAQSLNIQRTAENIRNVLSEDALANSRLGEVGEALQAIPGIYLEASTHQPSRAIIRGMSSEFNSVTFDGVGIGTWQGTRDAQVGAFPAENLARVEVMKSATPDQEGDAIGGSINLVSKRAFDLQGRLLRLGVGASYANQQQHWDKQFSLDYGDRFGADNRLGIFSSINYYRTDRAYHNVAQTYQVNAADEYNIATMTLLDRIEKGSWKLKYTGSIDYKLSEATTLSLRGLYSNDHRFLADYRSVYRPGARTSVTPDSATANNGRVDVDRPYREPETINWQVSLNLEHNTGLWKIDSTAGFSRISNRYIETITPLMSFNGVNMAYDRSERDFPVFTITNGVDLSDASRLSHRSLARTQYNSRNLLYNYSVNARRELANAAFKSYVKTGVRAKIKDWRQDVGDQGDWTYTGPRTPAELSMVYVNDRFMRQSDGRVQLPSVTPDVKKIIEIFHQNRSEFTRNDNASEIRLATNKKGFYEGVYSTYLMGGARFGKLNVITGARFERTDFEGWAHELDTPGGVLTAVRHVKTTTRSNDLLPSLNAIYSFTPRLELRGAVTKTLARPNPQDLLPIRRINDDNDTITDGNPSLGVTESVNYDLGLSYYLKPLGVASIGLFQKNIEGFYVSQVETIQSGEYAGYQLTRPGMGTGGEVRGLEADFQTRLTFLPGLLSGLGIGANHTWIESEGAYPNRPGATLDFTGAARRIWNLNVFFARGPIDLRAFLNYRGPYLNGVGARPALDVYEDERTTLSFFAKYKLNRRVNLLVDLNNISDSAKRSYQGDPSNPRSVRYYDWAANFRITYSL
jgi:TonB-dependent receptor